eukprot:TRINITY_DN15003_c0_g1_i1.p1 TRINITY_DN15003_c0_g1~~TRINITY_DN15003_c0_g1_i1.p1  ORF type:complete len:525 (-),score=114.26 TRINITY_DN15003_c0_g1_i1:390-1964(-)
MAPLSTTSSPERGADRGYSDVRRIGKGSFGTANLVRNRDGALCVMKSVDLGKLKQGERDEAVREVTVLASLKHPYIVRYHESFLDKHVLAIVMDYADGGDLAKRIQKTRTAGQKFAESQVFRWVAQITLALKYLHGRNILHRDLKPQNLFLTKKEQLRIGDFGISKVLDNQQVKSKESMIVGTPYYISPEICTEGLYSFASDVWALGCIFFELMTLRVPFDAHTPQDLMAKICRPHPPMLPETFTAEVRKMGADLLARDHKRRPDTAAILQYRLVTTEMSRMLEEEEHSEPNSRANSRPSSSCGPVLGGRSGSKGSNTTASPPWMHGLPAATPMPLWGDSKQPAAEKPNPLGGTRQMQMTRCISLAPTPWADQATPSSSTPAGVRKSLAADLEAAAMPTPATPSGGRRLGRTLMQSGSAALLLGGRPGSNARGGRREVLDAVKPIERPPLAELLPGQVDLFDFTAKVNMKQADGKTQRSSQQFAMPPPAMGGCLGSPSTRRRRASRGPGGPGLPSGFQHLVGAR